MVLNKRGEGKVSVVVVVVAILVIALIIFAVVRYSGSGEDDSQVGGDSGTAQSSLSTGKILVDVQEYFLITGKVTVDVIE